MSKHMEPVIVVYEDWMKEGVVSLHSDHYHYDPQEYAVRFTRWYEHPFSREKSIRVVALDGKKVIGFQSWVLWPYTRGDRVFSSLQSRESLIHEDYRGQGIWTRMLVLGNQLATERGIDFFVGFPHERSLPGLIKAGWKHILDLQWFARLVHPSKLWKQSASDSDQSPFETQPMSLNSCRGDHLRLYDGSDFMSWRRAISDQQKHLYYSCPMPNPRICFEMKLERGHGFNELVIGDIRSSEAGYPVLRSALRELFRVLRSHKEIAIVSIALNLQTRPNPFFWPLLSTGFLPIPNKKIYFCVKEIVQTVPLDDARLWDVFRADTDTW